MCCVLAACSSLVIELPIISAPEPLKAVEGAKKAAAVEKLVGLLEISAVREAHPLSPGPYILCIRGGVSDTALRHTYAVFFKNDVYVGTRMSVMVDNCDAQVFAPLT